MEIKNEKFLREQISSLVQDIVESAQGLEKYCIHDKICKLVVYEKGGKSESKHGNTKEDDASVFSSMIVQLPSGGDLAVKHMKSSSVYKSICPGSAAPPTACLLQVILFVLIRSRGLGRDIVLFLFTLVAELLFFVLT